MFNVASYPKEKMEEVINIEFMKGANYGKGGEITIDDVNEWEVINDWASWERKHPKYNTSYGQMVTDMNDMWAYDDLEENFDGYIKDWKEGYNLKNSDKKSVEELADKLWDDVLATAKTENAFEEYVKKQNEIHKKRMADIPENYYFDREDSDNYQYIFKHKGYGQRVNG